MAEKKKEQMAAKTYTFPNLSFSGTDMVATCHMPNADGAKKTYYLGSIQTITYSIYQTRVPVRSLSNVNAKDYTMGPRTIAGSLIFAVFNKHFAYEIIHDINDMNFNKRYTFLVDELPPFDITISCANEYGVNCKMVLYGVRLVNEGQVMSVNDIYTENTYQFVAMDIDYLTDQDGFSNFNTINSGAVITETPQTTTTTTAKTIASSSANTAKILKDTMVDLVVTPTMAPSADKCGNAKFYINPPQNSGEISVIDKKNNTIFKIDIKTYPGGTISVGLMPGEYEASYADNVNRKYSTNRPFFIQVVSNEDAGKDAAPIIDMITTTAMTVISNSKTHTKLKYAELIDNKEGIASIISLTSRRASINGLNPNTEYVLRTCSDDDKSESISVKTKTLVNSEQVYTKLKQYIINNASMFTNGTIIEYCAIVDEATDISSSSGMKQSILDAFTTIMNNTVKAINQLNPDDFKTQAEYDAKLAALTKKRDLCNDIIRVTSNIANDQHYSNNRSHDPGFMGPQLPAPYGEIPGCANGVVITDQRTSYLEFYLQYENISQYVAKVPASVMNQYNGKKSWKFNGRPLRKYYVYAYNEKDERSPKFEFYTMDDNERANIIKVYNDSKADMDNAVSNSSYEMKEAIEKNSFNDTEQDIVVICNAKNPNTNILPAPVVTGIYDDYIEIDTDCTNIIADTSYEYFMVVAHKDEAMLDTTHYKIKINRSNTITDIDFDEFGIRLGETYILWFEDIDGVQISKPTYALINQASDGDDKLMLYYAGKAVEPISNAMSRKITVTDEIESIINNVLSDETTNSKNVFSKIAINTISYKPQLPDMDGIMKALCESIMDCHYYVTAPFFDGKVTCSIDTMSMKFPKFKEAYGLTVCYINKDGVSYESSMVEKDAEATIAVNSSKGQYAMVFASDADMTSQSGMIFVDILKKKFKAYKIAIEEAKK